MRGCVGPGAKRRRGTAASPQVTIVGQEVLVAAGNLNTLAGAAGAATAGEENLRGKSSATAAAVRSIGVAADDTSQRLARLAEETRRVAREQAALDPRFTFVQGGRGTTTQGSFFQNLDGSPSQF